MTTKKAIGAGLLSGFVAAELMTTAMLLLATIGVATPLVLIGDRLSVFIPPGPFLSLMGRVGGYNHLKQLGVGSTIAGQLVVGAIGGAIFGWFARRNPTRIPAVWTMPIFVVLPIVMFAIALWPVLGTSYIGLPIQVARLVTLICFAVCVLLFERTLVIGFEFLSAEQRGKQEYEFTPAIGRRAFVLGAIGLAAAGGGLALARKLYRAATFSYDGTQYKGSIVQAITPNESFYCVTKNVVDPTVNIDVWHLEIGGLVQNAATWRFQDLLGFKPTTQETTLMCISNGLDAGLMSNAVWKGFPLRDLLDQAGVLSGAARVRLQGVDNYTDTIPLEKAMQPTTLLAYEMNGEQLSDRHGYPLRVIVPGYFGEKNVKWLTRVEVTDANAKGFYEAQGWGPDFIVPTRSRIDVPDDWTFVSLGKITAPIEVKGIAFGGDRGISRVELSFDDGQTWSDTEIYYSGGNLAWSLWKAQWSPTAPGDYPLLVRATDGEGDVQEWEEDRGPFSGVSGLHRINVRVTT
ncbi:MAG TPA: molybdopterin-dependent oxidoreductase [Pyrinomonadaceae bacterium]|jgi:DMSO/TMAO reductase YedYZ molybdopterin-dependent catalytic subunit|nr:molybdopterin-dependent oxidoreductase [Pyrinomonadaceae bacterium]